MSERRGLVESDELAARTEAVRRLHQRLKYNAETARTSQGRSAWLSEARGAWLALRLLESQGSDETGHG